MIKKPQTMNCAAKTNLVVRCEGILIASEGLCLKHAVLFDVWICEYQGWRIYATQYPRNWKRNKFHQWLNKIGNVNAEKIFYR